MAIAPRRNLVRFLRLAKFRDRYVAAVLKMKNDGVYQIFVDWHNGIDRSSLAPDGPHLEIPSVAHDNVVFLAWHRAFVRIFEIELQKADLALQRAADPEFTKDDVISLPYWRYRDLRSSNPRHARGRQWKDDFLGPNGSGTNNVVASGPFRGGGLWPIKKRRDPDLTHTPILYDPEDNPGSDLVRMLGNSGRPLPTTKETQHTIRLDIFDDNSFTNFTDLDLPQPHPSESSELSHRAVLEGFRATRVVRAEDESRMHNGVHVWVGGHMGRVAVAPNDPVFFLHHCEIDRLWALWQVRHPTLVAQYPNNADIDTVRGFATRPPQNPFARKLNEPMEPWSSAGRRWVDPNGTLLFSTDAISPRDVLKWTNMGAGLGGYRITGIDSRRIRF